MNIREFRKNLADSLNSVVTSGEPLQVENWNKPHVVVVSADTWKKAEAALRATSEQQQEESAA